MSDGGGDADRTARAPEIPSPGERMLEIIVAGTHRLRPDDLPRIVADAGAAIGGRHVEVYVVDLEQVVLVRFGGGGEGEPDELAIDGTVAGRAYRTNRMVAGEEVADRGSPGTRVWVPLVDGAERIGVMGITFDEPGELTLRRCGMLGSLAAELLVTRIAYGDTIPLLRRRRPMSLAAEMRWSQLPPLTFMAPEVAIAGVLEPAYDIAGDAFDYAVNEGVAHVAIFDAMGHGLEASRMASVAVAAYRHARRRRLGLVDLYRAIDGAIASQFGDERFVTGQLGRLDCPTGRLTWISAGHPRPLLLRGSRMVGELECDPGLPLGLGDDRPLEISETDLEPGDRVLFFSDGVVEARSPEGEQFGLDRLADFLERAAASEQPLAETTRRLVHSVLDHQADVLQDDATLLLLEWTPNQEPMTPATSHIEGP